jgi:WD40 repeat protein
MAMAQPSVEQVPNTPRLVNIGHPDDVSLLRFSPAGSRIALAQREGGHTALVVDVRLGQVVARLAEIYPTYDMVFLSEDQLLVLRGEERYEWLLWDLEKDRRTVIGEGAGSVIYRGVRSPDGETVALGGTEGAFLLNWPRKRAGRRFPRWAEEGAVQDLAFSPDGRCLAVASFDREYLHSSHVITVWDALDGTAVRTWTLESADLEALAFRPDNRLLAVAQWNQVHFYKMDAEKPVATQTPLGGCIQTLRLLANGRTVEALSLRGDYARFYAGTGRLLHQAAPPEGHTISGAALSEQGLAAGVVGHSLLLWEPRRQRGAVPGAVKES